MGTQVCTGEGTTYSSTYRIGASSTSSGELLQTFRLTSSLPPARINLVVHSLRAFGNASPSLHLNVYGPITGPVGSLGFSTMNAAISGDLPIAAIPDSGLASVPVTAHTTLVAGATYALRLSADGVGAAGTGSVLLGVGALSDTPYADGETFRAAARTTTAWGELRPTRFRPAGTFDLALALAFSGAAGSPCATASECSPGLVCHQSACRQPNPIPLAISPAAPTVVTNATQVFTASGGDAPYTFSLQAGDGSLAAATYTAPATAGSATVRVTDAFGFTSDATLTIAPPPTPAWIMRSGNAQRTGRSTLTASQTGAISWTLTPGGTNQYSSPVVAPDGTVYLGVNTSLVAINPTTAAVKWTYGFSGVTNNTPALATDGTVYVPVGASLHAVNPNGSLRWTYAAGAQLTAAPALGADGTIFLPTSNNSTLAINPNGTLKWSATGGAPNSTGAAVSADGKVYVPGNDNQLRAYDAATGAIAWTYNLGSTNYYGTPTVGADGTIYVGLFDSSVDAINPDGTLKWKFTTCGGVLGALALGASGQLYFGSNGCLLFYSVNASTGALNWTYSLGGTPLAPPLIGGDGILYLGTNGDKRFLALNPSGTVKWSYTATGNFTFSSAPAIGPSGEIYTSDAAGKIYAFAP